MKGKDITIKYEDKDFYKYVDVDKIENYLKKLVCSNCDKYKKKCNGLFYNCVTDLCSKFK